MVGVLLRAYVIRCPLSAPRVKRLPERAPNGCNGRKLKTMALLLLSHQQLSSKLNRGGEEHRGLGGREQGCKTVEDVMIFVTKS